MPSLEALQSVSYIHLAHTRCSVLPFVFSTEQLQRFHAVVFSLHYISLALLRFPFLLFSQWTITKTSRCCMLPFIDYNRTAVVPHLHFRYKQQNCVAALLPFLTDNHKTNYFQYLHCCTFFPLCSLPRYCFFSSISVFYTVVSSALHCCVFCSALLCHFFTLETLFFTLLRALLCCALMFLLFCVYTAASSAPLSGTIHYLLYMR